MASNSVHTLSSCSILNTVSLREIGNLKKKVYQDNITRLKLKHQFQKIHPIENMSKIKSFEYVHSDSSGNLIGVSRSKLKSTNLQTKTISHIYVMQFSYNPPCVNHLIYRNALLSSFKTIKTSKESVSITDTIEVHINGKNPILYAGNSNKEGMAVLTYFNCEETNLDYEWRVQDKTFCCTSCNFTQQYALGCEGGYYLFNTVRMNPKQVLTNEKVLSLQFSNDGNFLVIGSNRGVSIRDVREHACHRQYCKIKEDYGVSCKTRYTVETISPQIREMKLLNDQTSLICCDQYGSLEKVDTRMMKTVFKYQGHPEYEYRRRLCLNEDLDLICAPGIDKVVRIWSLSSGKLHFAKRVLDRSFSFINIDPPHCCFISNQRRWFLSAIQDNVLVPIVPTDEYFDLGEYETAPCGRSNIILN